MSFEATLENYLYAIDNVSGETAFLLEEIGHIDSRVQETRHEIIKRDVTEIQRHIKRNGLLSENPKEAGHVEKIRSDYARIAKLSDEKVALAERGVRMLDKYVQKLQGEFERLKEMGHNIGDTDTAPVTNAGLAGLGSPGVGGFPQLDMSSVTNSNKKRKLPSVSTQMHNGQMYASPTSAQLQAYQNNPYMQQLQQGNGNMQYPGQSGSSSAYNQFGNSPLSAQQQQQLALQLQNAYTNSGQLPGGAGPSGPGSSANNASRPHRPSRLSSSFSANGLAAGAQILPSTTAAHLPPGSGTPTTAAMMNGQAGVKRARPSGTAGNSQKNNKKKKRIQISDEESVLDEAMSVEDVDAEGEDDEGEEDRSLLSVGNGGPRRPGTLKAGSRQGTPSASSLLGNGGNNAGRPKNAASNKQARGQLQPLAPFPAFQARSAEEDAEGEDEDADAEGEEDFGLELDDANTEDPTLYCFCQRVSYGNMIACDNLDCKYEWFHWACVKVTKQPDDNEKWYCPECRKTMADKATGASTPKALTMSAGSTAYAQLQMQQQLMLQNQGSAGGASRSNRRA